MALDEFLGSMQDDLQNSFPNIPFEYIREVLKYSAKAHEIGGGDLSRSHMTFLFATWVVGLVLCIIFLLLFLAGN